MTPGTTETGIIRSSGIRYTSCGSVCRYVVDGAQELLEMLSLSAAQTPRAKPMTTVENRGHEYLRRGVHRGVPLSGQPDQREHQERR